MHGITASGTDVFISFCRGWKSPQAFRLNYKRGEKAKAILISREMVLCRKRPKAALRANHKMLRGNPQSGTNL